jgi:hypothetical protein
MLRSVSSFSSLLAAAIAIAPYPANAQAAAPAKLGVVQGFVYDSVHDAPLVGALVMIDGLASVARSTADGRYRIDSVPVGSHRLLVSHPLLDTIGMVLSSPPITVTPSATTEIDLSTPSAARIVSAICRDNRGPAAMMGQVRDASSNDPAAGARVQLVYEDGDPLGLKRLPVVRETVVDASGGYTICGLPAPLTGKVQVFRGGVSSGEVSASIGKEGLGLRSFSIASAQVSTVVADSGSGLRRVSRGLAVVSGRVLNKEGFPVQGGRVTVAGSGITTLTNNRGEFRLDSLPPGTQSLEVRKLGYSVAEQAVELTDGVTATAQVMLSPYELPAVTIEADRESALSRLGYTQRKKSLGGFFIDGDRIRPDAPHFSDVIRSAPALKFMPTADGHTAVVSSRDPNAGCVNFIVDRMRWKELKKGDIDDFVRPDEVRAIEVYNPESTPPQFETGGETSCVTVVVWTVRSTNRGKRK